MDEVKIGEILLPGEEAQVHDREDRVQRGFWPKLRRVASRIPFARDVLAAYFCAFDPQTPLKVRGVLLGALAYFILPTDVVPDIFALVGFSDDIAVLTAAFAMVRSHVKDGHYALADKALTEKEWSGAPEAVGTLGQILALFLAS